MRDYLLRWDVWIGFLVGALIACFDARVAAELRTFKGVQGHLATITSAQEDMFIATNFPEAVAHRNPEIEGDNTVAYWLLGFQPWSSEGEPLSNWQRVTGEPFVSTNWVPGEEPNDFDGREEDCLQPHPDEGPLWNDSECDREWGGYVVEYYSKKGK